MSKTDKNNKLEVLIGIPLNNKITVKA